MNNQVKLIDADKILSDLVGYIDKFSEEEADATREGDNDRAEEMSDRIELLRVFANGIMTGSYRPDTPPVPTIKPGDIIADLLFAYINKDDCPHDFEIKAFEDAIAYLSNDLCQPSKYTPDLFESHLKQMREVVE